MSQADDTDDAGGTALVIYGGWYFGQVVREAAQAAGWQVLGHVDPNPAPQVTTLDALPENIAVIVAVGDNDLRATLQERLHNAGRKLATVIHPQAVVSPSARIGAGVFIAELAVVRTNAAIGDGAVLQAGSVVSHDCTLHAFASLGPNAACASKTTIGRATALGVGAVVAPGLNIGAECTIGAGAAVFRDTRARHSLVGNPARATPRPVKDIVQSDWDANLVW